MAGTAELHPVFPIRTARLALRPLREEDIGDLLTYRGDAEVCRYLPFEPMDEQVLTGRLAADMGRSSLTADGQGLTLGVEPADRPELIGDVVLFYLSAVHRSGEIGYVFHPGVAGRGFATEACRALLALAFEPPPAGLGLHRVAARIDPRNCASVRVARRLGMRQEAHLRELEWFKGGWADLLVFALLEDEWRAAGDRDG